MKAQRYGKAYTSVARADLDVESGDGDSIMRAKISSMLAASVGIALVGLLLALAASLSRPPRLAPSSRLDSQPQTEVGAAGSAAASPEPPSLGRAEEDACRLPLPRSSKSSEDEPEPPAGKAAPGERVRIKDLEDMEYQLFLPAAWSAKGSQLWPVVVFLHGAGDGKFSVMNSQSLPRLLARDQSTCFDDRHCWCLDREFKNVTAKREAPAGSPLAFLDENEDLQSPLADCDFAETFGAIVVMPQGWLPELMLGWTREKLSTVEKLTRLVLKTYRGDPSRVSLTGQSAGGNGAWHFAAWRPKLWSSVSVVCSPMVGDGMAEKLMGVHVWVAGWTEDGEMGNDETVQSLKRRRTGSVRYTRYLAAPAPPDPKYSFMRGHASYDLIYRDPRLWKWALSQVNLDGTQEWKTGQ